MTREHWLNKAVDELRELFKPHALIPSVRVSIGFPGGGSARKRIGEYWHPEATQDQIPQVFISPVLKTPMECLDVLVHELVHACTPGKGHGKEFRRLALKVGLTGKMRSTVAGPDLIIRLNALSEKLGEFPHGAINLSNRKKQSARMLKVECLECGYTCRVTKKWIEDVGPPLCPCNHNPMEPKSIGG